MSLQDWLRNRWLVAHETSPQEVADLLALADRDLADARIPGLSSDAKLRLAYNAGLQAATAALAAAGFRTGRGESHHFRTIQSLAHTVGADSDLVEQFDAFRKKRNTADYERPGVASDHDAEEMIAFAQDVRRDVEAWLRTDHPSLLR